MGKVVVAGSFIYDIAAYVPHAPVAGETVMGYECKTGPGGKGSNQAVAAAKAGAEVTMITKVGKDDFAKSMFDFYNKNGMSTKYIYETTEAGTGVAPIIIEESGQNRIAVILGANALLTAEEVAAAEEEIADADVLLTQFETCNEAVTEFIRLGKKHGKMIIVNPAPINKTISEEIYKGVDYVTPNETEAAALADMDVVETIDDAREAAKRIIKLGAKAVLITLGSNGSFLYNGTEEFHVMPIKVKAVDTTGAGDAFNGGLLAALSEGKELRQAIPFAQAVAALSVQRLGTTASMPTREEIDSFLSQRS
jgi:ribokinase